MSDVLDPAASVANMKVAIARSDGAAADEWKRLMDESVAAVAMVKLLFTSDDVFERAARYGDAFHGTHELRAMGGVMRRAARRGVCMKANCPPRPSRKATQNRQPLTVWRSLVAR